MLRTKQDQNKPKTSPKQAPKQAPQNDSKITKDANLDLQVPVGWPQRGEMEPKMESDWNQNGINMESLENAQTKGQLLGMLSKNINFGVWKLVLGAHKKGSEWIVCFALPLVRKHYFCLPDASNSDPKVGPRTDLPPNNLFQSFWGPNKPRKQNKGQNKGENKALKMTSSPPKVTSGRPRHGKMEPQVEPQVEPLENAQTKGQFSGMFVQNINLGGWKLVPGAHDTGSK